MLNASKDQLCSKLCRHNIRTLAGCKYLGVFSKVLLCNPLEAGLNSVLRLLKNLLTHIHQTHLVSCLCRHLCVCVCVCGGGGGGGGGGIEQVRFRGASQHAQPITDSQLLRRGPSFLILRVSGHRYYRLLSMVWLQDY